MAQIKKYIFALPDDIRKKLNDNMAKDGFISVAAYLRHIIIEYFKNK